METKEILTDSSKWEEWDRAFKAYLKGLQRTGYLDSTEVMPTKPRYPIPRSFMNNAQYEAFLEQSSQESAATLGGEAPRALDEPKIVRSEDLTSAPLRAYTDALNRYKLENDIFEKHLRAYDEIRKWMRATVKHEYAISALDDDVEIPKMYANLKRIAGTSDADIQAKIYEAYKTHLAPRSKPLNVDKWADE